MARAARVCKAARNARDLLRRSLLWSHDPSGKPVPTFPDHAPGKKRAVKLGDLTALSPSDGGGRIPSEGSLEGASFGPAPRKEPSAGATDAGETLHLSFNPWPAALPRTATNRRSSRA